MATHNLPPADIKVPKELSKLPELAYNLWWSWTPRARRLFSAINSQLWWTYRNPVQLLINIEPHHWDDLLGGGVFMSGYRKLIRNFEKYMDPDQETPFKKLVPNYDGGPVAYLSTEFGLYESLGIYCGGLGVLSGDHAKAASDFGLPFVGVGLLYKRGYFRQAIDPDGRQHHIFDEFDFTRMPITPLQSETGRRLIVSVDFPGREVKAQVWQLNVGRIKLYLLDTDIPENDPADRPITSQLYVRGREMRLCQELMLGVGGVRAIRALGIQPAVWHMNEGHSALMLVERMRHKLSEGMTWDDSMASIKEDTVFTTHTPVPAGNETFDMGLAEKYLQVFADAMGVKAHTLMDLGKSYPEGGGQPYNLTALAFRFSRYNNGVSKLHAEVSNHMWHHIFPGRAEGDEPVKAITNGVHVATWLGHDIRTLFEEELGQDWQDHLDEPDYWQGVHNIDNRDVWQAHIGQKEHFIKQARARLVKQWARHGKSPDEMREIGKVMDPYALTIGFARRFATYKRAGLIFQDFNRLRSIITDSKRPVQFVFSGKAHPADAPGQELVRRIYSIAYESELRGHVFFLEDYEMRIARLMVQGVDVWLNTPRRPREASGTSGMKAAINGALNLSIADGWWPEAYNQKNGWLISDGREFENEEMQDYEDSSSFYDLLGNQVVPLFYDNRDNGIPVGWIEHMKESMATIIPGFSMARMIRDYARDSYFPDRAVK